MYDFAKESYTKLDTIKTTQDFCTDWKSTWRNLAITAQSILSLLFPPGAKVIGFLIAIADSFCNKG